MKCNEWKWTDTLNVNLDDLSYNAEHTKHTEEKQGSMIEKFWNIQNNVWYLCNIMHAHALQQYQTWRQLGKAIETDPVFCVLQWEARDVFDH